MIHLIHGVCKASLETTVIDTSLYAQVVVTHFEKNCMVECSG